MRLCDYCRRGLAILGYLEIGDYAFCDVDCAERYIDQLRAELKNAEDFADLLEDMSDKFEN